MKFARHLVSDKGIFFTTVVLLMISAALAIAGIHSDLHAQAAGMTPVIVGADVGVPYYILQAVMGNVPSTAGTLLSVAMLLGWIITPLVASMLIAIKASIEHSDQAAAEHAAAEALYAV